MAHLEYDLSTDQIHICLLPDERQPGIVHHCDELVPDRVFLEYTADGRLYGIEFLVNRPIVFRDLTSG